MALLVEDDVLVRRAIVRAVGQQVAWLIADSVAQARAILESSETFCGAIVDVQLPDGTGFEIAERIRANSARTPVLMLSGHDPYKLIRGGFALGVTVLSKPVSAADLVEWLRRAAMQNNSDFVEPRRADAFRHFLRMYGLRLDQVQLLRWRLAGRTNREIAVELDVTVDAVKNQVSRVLAKTGCRNVRAIVAALDKLAIDE